MHTTKRTILAAAVSILITGYTHADEHFAEIVQIGNDNNVTQSQSGIGQRASSSQSGFLLITDIEQLGARNSAITYQAGPESQIQIIQDGAANQVRVDQAAEVTGHRASIFQTGAVNEASVEQLEGVGNGTSLTQIGDANVANVQQQGFGGSFNGVQEGVSNVLSVVQLSATSARTVQTGSDNVITLSQDGFPYGSFASISQDGTGNEATLDQRATGRYPSGDVQLTQTGTDNLADVTTQIAFGNFAFTQDGTGNELTARSVGLDVSFVGSSVGDYNRVTVDQDGRDISLVINQYGDNNEIDIEQSGLSGSASFEQTGNENYAAVIRTGEYENMGGDSSAVMQNGMGNSAVIMQSQ